MNDETELSEADREAFVQFAKHILLEKVTVNTTNTVNGWFKAGFGFTAGAWLCVCLYWAAAKLVAWVIA